MGQGVPLEKWEMKGKGLGREKGCVWSQAGASLFCGHGYLWMPVISCTTTCGGRGSVNTVALCIRQRHDIRLKNQTLPISPQRPRLSLQTALP